MNKFIYPFAAAAALFTGNLFAQEAALSSAQNDAPTSLFDCFVKVEEHNRTLGLKVQLSRKSLRLVQLVNFKKLRSL